MQESEKHATRRLLLVFVRLFPRTGYCQGMNKVRTNCNNPRFPNAAFPGAPWLLPPGCCCIIGFSRLIELSRVPCRKVALFIYRAVGKASSSGGSEAIAFWTFAALCTRVCPMYYVPTLAGVQADATATAIVAG